MLCTLTRQWIKSTIQLIHISTSNMKIGVRPLLLELFDFFSQKLIFTTYQNSHQFGKKLINNHWIGFSSSVTDFNGILTNINIT